VERERTKEGVRESKIEPQLALFFSWASDFHGFSLERQMESTASRALPIKEAG
jgi:hypothetical protein